MSQKICPVTGRPCDCGSGVDVSKGTVVVGIGTSIQITLRGVVITREIYLADVVDVEPKEPDVLELLMQAGPPPVVEDHQPVNAGKEVRETCVC